MPNEKISTTVDCECQMNSAADAANKISVKEAAFEESAKIVADYLADTVAASAIEEMIASRKREFHRSYDLKKGYGPGMRKAGLAGASESGHVWR